MIKRPNRALDDLVKKGADNPLSSVLLCKTSAANRTDTTRTASVVGGAYRDRTDDLLNANQALSQLS